MERDGDTYYFVIPLRNVGAGLAVLHSWHLAVLQPRPDTGHPETSEFRRTHSTSTCLPATSVSGKERYVSATTRSAQD
ncbi:MAG: hypothetical protein ACXVFQ_22290 [Solirubrobacteraceae bacterium]